MKRIALFMILIFLITTMAKSGDDAVLKFKGLVQTWFSYGELDNQGDDNGYGFTLRRLRLNPYGKLGKNINWGFQVGWDKQTAALIDAYIEFAGNKAFKIKIGQFAAPGTVSGALTSSGKLDFVERAAITLHWNSNSALFGCRALGIQAHGDLANGKIYYAVMLANPKTIGLFNPGVKSSFYTNENNGIMVWSRLEAKPVTGLRIGAFYGSGKETESDFVRKSYGGHLFYVKDAINFKAEYIAGEYGLEDEEAKYNGAYALLGYRTGKWEPIARYGLYRPNDGNPDSAGAKKYNNITLGINYYYNKMVKIQVNYVIRDESMYYNLDKLKNNLFYICFQYTYK